MSEEAILSQIAEEKRSLAEARNVISDALRKLGKEEHVHIWDIRGVYSPPRPAHPRLQWDRITIVLFCCKECNYPTTETLNGIWTIEQVRGEYDEDQDPA